MNNLFKKKKKYLYLITPSELLRKKLPLKKYLIILNEVLKTKKIKFLQLRLKRKSENQILYALKKISLICKKNKTIIQDNAFIGSNTSLVAPVNIGKNSKTGAGSVITRNIAPNSLVVGLDKLVIAKKTGKK